MKMTSRIALAALLASFGALGARGEDEASPADPVFSGPQVGERVPDSLPVVGVWDDDAGKESDIVKKSGDGPLLVVFVHKLTRPSFGLVRLVTDWAVDRGEDKIATRVVWLGKDRSEAEAYLRRARRSLNIRAAIGVSPDGEEGPGAWGLNRNVTLTFVVAKDRTVTANFALIQPSDTDAPRILRAVADIAGGEPPTLEEIRAKQSGRMARRGARGEGGGGPDPELATRLRAVIQRDLTSEEAERAIRELEEWIGDDAERQRALGEIAARVTSGAIFERGGYGGKEARTKLVEWARKWGPDAGAGEGRSDARGEARVAPRRALARSLSFYASFDEKIDADFARGEACVHSAPDGKVANGRPDVEPDGVEIVPDGGHNGGALRFKKKSSSWLYWPTLDNVAWRADDFQGTISFWLRLDPDKDLEPGYCDPFQISGRAWNDASIFVDFTDKPPRSFRLGAFADRKIWDPKERSWDDVPESERPMATVTDPPFSRDRFTHVVVTFAGFNRPGDDGVATLYLDGERRGEVRGHPQIHTWDPETAAIFLGVSYIGDIDELAVFDRPLAADEVKLLHELDGGIRSLRPRARAAREREAESGSDE